MTYHSIKPGQVWLDTQGKRIQAHGGSVIAVGEVFYWYGENKEKTKPGNGIWHWGVRCYASTDLYNWEDKGVIIPPNEEDEASPLHPSQYMDRPHILFNRHTQKFVCWLKVMQKDGTQKSTVLTADDILGPYTMVQSDLRPLHMSAGDFDLVEAADGKAYYYFERVHSEMICADLTADYTDITGYYSTHFPQLQPPDVREAPAYFFRKGLHYLFTSGTTGYHSNPSEVAVAKSFHGPWEVLGDPHPNDASRTSYNSQITSVFKHPFKKDLYIALADRWIPNLPELAGENYATGKGYAETAEIYRKMFNPDIDFALERPHYSMDMNIDTSVADYVWLPVRFDGRLAYLDWREEWRIEDYE
ncbi:family 43 glycosylhydrolase [Saccharibacillus sp. CPCC 101409]|uniref:family 43 glycosylhydrolase n=1 Tax=Saccharibacillus sp. CPCC 101409 TaxID=3058041 RepID=UPI002670E7D2|nr:family 43 glycosylhydrolase [Saccharibacillus sp. CPCC 101409]MDO3411920.1 family 43 glycosylhydrolase [Saccharibacillus sp. CPCC 101409]